MENESKEYIIKEAYGRYYPLLKNGMDEFGWLQISQYDDSFDDLTSNIEMICYFDHQLQLNFSRPKEIEIWKDVPDYEGFYQVSDMGRIRTYDRKSKNDRNVNLDTKIIVKKICFSSSGYGVSSLGRNGKKKQVLISRLCYYSFYGNLKKGFVIDHKNNKKEDNRLINLQQITYRKNITKDKKGKLSKFTGVCLEKRSMRWKTTFFKEGKRYSLGSFKTEEEASEVYQKVVKIYETKLKTNKIKIMKTVAVITNNYRDFNTYRLEQHRCGELDNFIQVQTIEDVLKNQFNDYVNKSNSVKMPNVNEIIKAVENNINQLN